MARAKNPPIAGRPPEHTSGRRATTRLTLTASLGAALFVGAVGLAAPPAVQAQHVERLDELLARAGSPVPEDMARISREAGGWAARARASTASGRATEGSLPVLLIPALFSDSPEPGMDTEGLRRLYFQGPADPGTLPDFFEEASGGRFTVTGEVASWHRTSVSRDSATGGPETTFGIGPGFGDYLLEALAAADAELDFGQFDNDGPDGVPNSGDDNGVVDALSFFFVEAARSCGGPGVWPHFAGISPRNGGLPYASDDPRPGGGTVVVDPYLIVSASECDGTPEERIAVIAHELGHNLGLPDLYHPTGDPAEAILSVNRRWVVGCFGLMAAGAWGCGPADEFPSFGPTHLSPWSRRELGWSEELRVPAEVRRETYTLEPAWSSRQMLSVPLSQDPEGEALFIEYRARGRFDAPLPADGILIYRFRPGAPFRPLPAGPKEYRISLVEADGDSTLLRTHGEGGNRGERSDIFAVNGATDTALTFGLVTINSMAVVDGRARVEVSTHTTPALVVEGTTVTLEALEPPPPLLIGGGVPPYTVDIGTSLLPPGLVAPSELTDQGVDQDVVFLGRPTATGRFPVTVTIRDARGTEVHSGVTLDVFLTVPPDALVGGLLEGRPGAGPRADQRELLDREGNADGRFDIGDLRRHVLGM